MRRIIVNLHGLTPEKRELEKLELAYNCRYFIDRHVPWDIEYDNFGNYIDQKQRKPSFEDPVAREIIDSTTAHVFGYDKFPTVTAKTHKDIYASQDLIKLAMERGEMSDEETAEMLPAEINKLKIKLAGEELQKLANTLMTQTLLNPPMVEASRLALIGGRSMALFKIIEGQFYTEVINWKFIENLKMHQRIPGKVESFSEMYMFEEHDPLEGKNKRFYHRRDFTEESEVLYQPILIENMDPKYLKDLKWVKKDESVHGFGFCPAVIIETPTKRSILDGQLENIESYIFFTNNIYTGLRMNMNPQWALLMEKSDKIPKQTLAPKRKGGIWVFYNAKDFRSIAPQADGYDTARTFRRELRTDILKACRVADIPVNNQQSGTALSIRISPTLDAVGEYRISFGENGLVKLCEMMLRAVIKLKNSNQRVLVRSEAIIPDVDDFYVTLAWGEILPVTEETVFKAVNNALMAYKGGLLELEPAVYYIASYFNVSDVEEMIKNLRKKAEYSDEESQSYFDKVMESMGVSKEDAAGGPSGNNGQEDIDSDDSIE